MAELLAENSGSARKLNAMMDALAVIKGHVTAKERILEAEE